ncbi:MAG: hypothetical protein ACRDI3_01555, partial [Actinomycetota bacterium]
VEMDATAPFMWAFDTLTVADGRHMLEAILLEDGVSKETTSLTVKIANGLSDSERVIADTEAHRIDVDHTVEWGMYTILNPCRTPTRYWSKTELPGTDPDTGLALYFYAFFDRASPEIQRKLVRFMDVTVIDDLSRKQQARFERMQLRQERCEERYRRYLESS